MILIFFPHFFDVFFFWKSSMENISCLKLWILLVCFFFKAYNINIIYSSDPLLQLNIFRRVSWV